VSPRRRPTRIWSPSAPTSPRAESATRSSPAWISRQVALQLFRAVEL
jgi:hypothetical protein